MYPDIAELKFPLEYEDIHFCTGFLFGDMCIME